MSDYEYDYTEYLYRPPQQFVAVPDEFIMTPNYAPYSPRSASPLVKVIHASHTAAIAKNDDGWARMCSDAWSDDWADEPVGSEEVGPLLNDPDYIDRVDIDYPDADFEAFEDEDKENYDVDVVCGYELEKFDLTHPDFYQNASDRTMLFPPYAHVYWPFAGAADAIVHPIVDGQICRPVDTTYFCPILLMEPARRVTSNGLFVPDIILTDEYPYPYTHNRVSSIYPIPWAPPATEYFCPIFEQISGWHWQCVPFDPRIDLFQHTAEVEKLVITSFSTPGEDMDETLPSPIFTDIVTPPLTPLTSFAHTVEIFTVDDTITAFSASSAIIEDTRFDASVASGASKLLGLDTINEDNAYTASIECSAVIEDLHDDASELLNFREIIAEDHIVTNTAAHIAFKIPDIIIHAPTPPLQVIFPKSVNTYYEELRPLSTAEDQPATITPAAEDLWNNHFSTDDRSSRKLGWVSRVLTRVLGRWL